MKQVLDTGESRLAAPPQPFPTGSPCVGRNPRSRSCPGPEAEFAGQGLGLGLGSLPCFLQVGGPALPEPPRGRAAVHPRGAALTAQLLRRQEQLPKPTHGSTQGPPRRLQTPAPRPGASPARITHRGSDPQRCKVSVRRGQLGQQLLNLLTAQARPGGVLGGGSDEEDDTKWLLTSLQELRRRVSS